MFEKEVSPYLEQYFSTLEKYKIKSIIEYSVKGGKCIRGFIVKHILDCFVGDKAYPWEPVVAAELIHAASLIIDDLPCMDNDKERRGKPSTFVKVGKHEAILFSFYIVSESLRLLGQGFRKIKGDMDKIHYLQDKWCELLGKNLVVGQMMDLQCDAAEWFNIPRHKDFNENIIEFKTSSLFSFTFILGAIFSNQDANLEDFQKMGQCFGMMFQLVDDYKDIKEDNSFKNYILTHGMQKSVLRYIQAKSEFIRLLQKYNLHTKEFTYIICTLDDKFNLSSHSSTLNTQNAVLQFLDIATGSPTAINFTSGTSTDISNK